MVFVLLALPVFAILMFAILSKRKIFHTINIFTISTMAIMAVMLTRSVMLHGKVSYKAFGGVFYIDSLSIIILDIVLFIGLMAGIYSIGYLEEELKRGKFDFKRIKAYYMLMYSFMFTMVLVLTVKNMGIMWIAIEATTLASAFLVGFHNDKRAIEAAWKYIIICSVGIAIALLGIIFLHLSSVEAFNGTHLLDWKAMADNATTLKSPILRLSFIFILIGFGTKAGLAPMHTWLPDAHSQAPSPISALLSGVLLNSAVYAIIRTVSIVNKNLGSNVFTGQLLIIFGILSIITAAVFILTQRDYKRLLAYSSIEHIGIIAVAIGIFTPVSIFAAIFHMINHSLTKSMLFLSSGSILQKYGTREISKIKGLLKILPVSGTAFLLGLFAIAGTPPFSVFASEFNIMISIFDKKLFLLGGIFIVLLAIVFAGIALTLFKVFYGDTDLKNVKSGEVNIGGTVAILILLILIFTTGLYMPNGLKHLITDAQKIVIGS